MRESHLSRARQVFAIALLTFFLSSAFSLGSSSLMGALSLPFSVILLVVVVIVGVLFDTLGVAAAAGSETPFHAMAAKRITGAKQCIWMLRNADRVAAFASDVVGDIAGTLSGAMGAAIVFRLLLIRPSLHETFWNTVVIGLVAAMTVGGKAYGKTVALDYSTEILFLAGRVLAALERLGISLNSGDRPRRSRQSN